MRSRAQTIAIILSRFKKKAGRGAGLASRTATMHRDPIDDDAFTFTTGSVDDHTFPQAQSALKSLSHFAHRAFARTVDNELQLDAQHVNSIGDTKEWGSEPSLVTEINNAPDAATVRYSAALKGEHGNQKAVLTFMEDHTGLGHLYAVDIPNSAATMDQLRTQLDVNGVAFRTFIPGKTHTRVMVYQNTVEENTTEANMLAFGDHYGVDIKRHSGSGEFIGGDTREEGRAAYREVIDAYEAQPNHRRVTTTGTRVHSARRQAAVPVGT